LQAKETHVEPETTEIVGIRVHGRRAAQARSLDYPGHESWSFAGAGNASGVAPDGDPVPARFLSLDMQPIIDLRTGRIARVQALARLHLADGIVQVESEYLPMLTVDQLDAMFRHQVLEAAMWLRRWDEDSLALSISVTVGSSTLLAPNFTRWLCTTVDRFDIERERLTLEIIETHGVTVDSGRAEISQLASLGFGIGLDALGGGVAGIDQLNDIPFQSIKIDRELLANLGSKPQPTIGLLAAASQLGVDFGRKVIIQGIENDSMLEVASILGVAYGQGAFLGIPIAAEQVASLVSGFNATPRGSVIRSLLGAIAYQVKIDRTPFGSHPELERCPLTPFLEGLGGDGVDLHDAVHGAGFAHHAHSELLTSWLAEQLGTLQEVA
jgi:EAL domain-containing protein (putative c-di-GMP-specific phosphodiesterase class I)